MFWKRRKRGDSEDINLEPLMDLHTAAVGVMLFVVIFAVMSARGAHVRMFTPRLQGPPAGSERVIFLCKDGRVRLFDWDGGKRRLLAGAGGISYDNVPFLVKKANSRGISDGNFRYTLSYTDWGSGDEHYRSLSLIAEPIANVSGDSVEDLGKESSKFSEALKRFDKRKVWITFLVDGKSIEIFRKARNKALQYGFASGWDPVKSMTFPYRECIKGCGRDEDRGVAIGSGIQW